MTKADLAEFQSEWVEPISTNYHGYDVFELPPPGQGFAALEMLNILEVCVPKFGISARGARTGQPAVLALHGGGEEARLLGSAGEERRPEVRAGAGQGAALEVACGDRCAAGSTRTTASRPAVAGGLDGGTIYLTTADRWGNMVSLIHSVFGVYGSRATVPPYGFVLHNRGARFSLDPTSPNIVAPHKRPFHTIIAGFVMQDGQPLMTFGNMGGSVQPETHAQHMVNMIDLGMNVQMTTDAARFTHNQSSNVLSLETNLFNLVGAALEGQGPQGARGERRSGRRLSGHPVHARSAAAGAGRSIGAPPTEDRPVNGVYRAGSDHRKDGEAVGW